MRSKVGRIALVVSVTALFAGLSTMPAAHAAVKRCFGKPVTLPSTAKAGTAGSDVWVGTKGNNLFNGKGGNDFLCGGGGTDGILGGTGKDKIDGGAGGDGTALCQGNIFLDGGAGNDTILGGSGFDCIRGGSGNDNLAGGDDDDVLYGGTGSDKMNGGANGNPLATPPTGIGDTVSFSDLAAAVNANLASGTATSGGDTDTISAVENAFGTALADQLTGNNTGVTALLGSTGDDTLTASPGALVTIAAFTLASGPETINLAAGNASGPDGNDTLQGQFGGADGSRFGDTITGFGVIFGEDGNDTINIVGNVGSTIDAGPGNDNVNSGNGADKVLGGEGDDTIKTGGGDDQVLGGNGNDDIDAGPQTQFDVGACGAGTDVGKNIEVDANTGQPVGATGRPADCES